MSLTRLQACIGVSGLLAILQIPCLASAQEPSRGNSTRVLVTVALVQRLPVSDARFVIQRRPDTAPNDVILLSPAATAADLDGAFHTLLVARQAGGDFPALRATVRMRPHDADKAQGRKHVQKKFPWVQKIIRDLQKAEMRDVAGVGQVRSVDVWLPRQRTRGAK